MFYSLTKRAFDSVECLVVGILQNSLNLLIKEPTAFLQLFDDIVTKLETSVEDLSSFMEEECRELLSIVGTRLFSNLLEVEPKFDFATVMKPLKRSKVMAPKRRRSIVVLSNKQRLLNQRGAEGIG